MTLVTDGMEKFLFEKKNKSSFESHICRNEKKNLNPFGSPPGMSCIMSAKSQILTGFRDRPPPLRSLETTAGRSRGGSALQKKRCFSSWLEDGEGKRAFSPPCHSRWLCLGKLSSLSCASGMSQEPHHHLLGSVWPSPQCREHRGALRASPVSYHR